MSAPPGQTRVAEEGRKPSFRRLIAGAANQGHELATPEPAKRRAFVSCVSGPAAHSPSRSFDLSFPNVDRTFFAASFAYRGGTAFPIRSHTASI